MADESLSLSAEAIQRLETAKNIWVASVRPDGRPHLTPVWFAWHAGHIYISIEPDGVKGRNIAQNPQVVLALEDGLHPVICEGRAQPVPMPWPEDVLRILFEKYEWDLNAEGQYNHLVEVIPQKWLAW